MAITAVTPTPSLFWRAAAMTEELPVEPGSSARAEAPVPDPATCPHRADASIGFTVALQALQVAAEVGGGLITKVGIFFEGFGNYFPESCGERGIQLGGRSGLTVEDRAEDYGGSFAGEWQRTRCHLVENDSGGK